VPPLAWEIAANVFNAASILLAGRNSVHTWWTGIVGCLLFGYVFFGAKLYADVTLQAFFVASCIVGWWRWVGGVRKPELPVRHTSPSLAVLLGLAGIAVATGYGLLLRTFTDAYSPFLDSFVLAFSVLGQLLMIERRVESWWCWLLVNTVAVPLFFSRGLYPTAILYVGFWINAIVSLRHWQKLAAATRNAAAGSAAESSVA